MRRNVVQSLIHSERSLSNLYTFVTVKKIEIDCTSYCNAFCVVQVSERINWLTEKQLFFISDFAYPTGNKESQLRKRYKHWRLVS